MPPTHEQCVTFNCIFIISIAAHKSICVAHMRSILLAFRVNMLGATLIFNYSENSNSVPWSKKWFENPQFLCILLCKLHYVSIPWSSSSAPCRKWCFETLELQFLWILLYKSQFAWIPWSSSSTPKNMFRSLGASENFEEEEEEEEEGLVRVYIGVAYLISVSCKQAVVVWTSFWAPPRWLS